MGITVIEVIDYTKTYLLRILIVQLIRIEHPLAFVAEVASKKNSQRKEVLCIFTVLI